MMAASNAICPCGIAVCMSGARLLKDRMVRCQPGMESRSASSRPPEHARTVRHELEQSPLYSEELGIDLAQGTDGACFRWFLASLLFGARIPETTAKNTYLAFIRHGLTTPAKIVAAGWDFLVSTIMREGGYVRYDESKSAKILRDCETLINSYGGSLNRLHECAHDARDLEEKLLAFYGVGPVTVNIFLRELRPFWAKAAPDPLPAVERIAKELGVNLTRYDRKSLVFARVEAGLIRQRHGLKRIAPSQALSQEPSKPHGGRHAKDLTPPVERK
jgi:endonuclease III